MEHNPTTTALLYNNIAPVYMMRRGHEVGPGKYFIYGVRKKTGGFCCFFLIKKSVSTNKLVPKNTYDQLSLDKEPRHWKAWDLSVLIWCQVGTEQDIEPSILARMCCRLLNVPFWRQMRFDLQRWSWTAFSNPGGVGFKLYRGIPSQRR